MDIEIVYNTGIFSPGIHLNNIPWTYYSLTDVSGIADNHGYNGNSVRFTDMNPANISGTANRVTLANWTLGAGLASVRIRIRSGNAQSEWSNAVRYPTAYVPPEEAPPAGG